MSSNPTTFKNKLVMTSKLIEERKSEFEDSKNRTLGNSTPNNDSFI